MEDDGDTQIKVNILRDIGSPDNDARGAFCEHFRAEIDEFATYMSVALNKWGEFFDGVPEDDERRRAVVAILFTTINLNVTSFKLFMSGHTVAAGGLFRQVIESVALALLCSAKDLPVLGQFMDDQYSSSNAVAHLVKFRKAAHVRKDALEPMTKAYKFFHKFSHPTKLTIASSVDFSAGGVPRLGAFFDPDKLKEYQKDVSGRISLSKAFPNFIDGVLQNVAKW
ncbi:hypothetical protein [Paraburkholderia aspalathi]|uniref:hypothetical protein n=1 Tax=Paraburkholderia aspalathi TaxID=1324617 RepID=UPI001B2D69FB|nr:hypothetical protein [Paraburkholderia aspalathi]CAE6701514.1 hypothetical protein R20943_00593 [Paraburkholderia aspalathi]